MGKATRQNKATRESHLHKGKVKKKDEPPQSGAPAAISKAVAIIGHDNARDMGDEVGSKGIKAVLVEAPAAPNPYEYPELSDDSGFSLEGVRCVAG